MYKLLKSSMNNANYGVMKTNEDGSITSFLFDPENADYQLFKAQINDESAQLEDADGVLMSPEAAKAYVATLP
jgi:hypothetical protein